MVDHVIKTQSPLALKKNPSILNALGSKDELGGSSRVTSDELQALLITAGEFATKAGGSAANTLPISYFRCCLSLSEHRM